MLSAININLLRKVIKMKKRISKILALLLCLTMLPVAGLTVNAAAGTSAGFTTLLNIQDGQTASLTASSATIATAENLPGKTAEDKGLKLNINAGSASAYANLNVRDNPVKESTLSARTVVFDVYPNETVSAIQFRGRTNNGGEVTLSTAIPMSALTSGQWNKVMFLYNPSGTHSVYINNVLYEMATKPIFRL